MRRHRVLLIASTFPAEPGDGTPEFVGDLAVELAKTMDVRVLVPAVPGAPSRSDYRGVDVRRFRFFPKRWEDLAEGAILENIRGNKMRMLQVLPFFISETVAIMRNIRSFKPDVVHSFWIIPQGLSVYLANRKIPVLITTLGGDLYALVDTPARGIVKKIVRRADHTTVMNRQMKSQVEQLGADASRVSVEPMGADLEGINPHTVRDITTAEILFVGRLVEKKGLKHLISALKNVTIPWQLTVVGDGPLEQQLKAQAGSLPITFVGAQSRDQLRPLYSTSDMIVLPSVRAVSGDQDGLPVVLLEALASGLPAIASDLPGIDTVITDGETGLLVPPGDEAELARAVERLAGDRALREKVSSEGAKRADEHGVEAVGRRYAALLESIVSRS